MVSTEFPTPDHATQLAALLVAAMSKAMVVLMLGSACAILARGASAASRHLIWALTLGGALVVPVVAAVVPAWPIPMATWELSNGQPQGPANVSPVVAGPSTNVVLARAIPAADVPRQPVAHVRRDAAVPGLAVAATPSSGAEGGKSVTSPPVTMAGRADVGGSGWNVASSVIGIWLIGVIVVLIPTVVGLARLATLRRSARAMHGGRWALLVPSVMRELDIRRRVRFLEIDDAPMPMTWGLVRPVVLLPAGDFDSTIEQRLDVLRHELAHVRRHDCLTQLMGQIACALYWFNPLAWLAARELRLERERACDDEVLRAGSKASAYADYLLRVARTMRVPGGAALGGLAMARPSQLAGRLLAVLDDARRRDRVSTRVAVRATLVAMAVVATIASLTPMPASARVAVAGVAATAAPSPLDAPIVTEIVAPETPPQSFVPGVAGVLASASAPAEAPGMICDRTARSTNSSNTNWTSSENGRKRWRVQWSVGDCSYEIEARGDITYNRDVTDVASISTGGSFTFEEHDGDVTRRLSIRPRSDGSLERTYSVDGSRREYDATAQAWFAQALVILDRQTAFAVEQRVPAILDRGGVSAVLQEISLLGSDYARRRYYTKLLSLRELDRKQVRTVVEQAGAEISSDYELAELLINVSKRYAIDDGTRPVYLEAVGSIESDYEHRRVLGAIVAGGGLTPSVTRALLEDAARIESDYELTEFLVQVAGKGPLDETTRDAYFSAADKVGSDYEHHRALKPLLKRDVLTKPLARAILASATRIESDYEASTLLVELANVITIDDELRPAFEKAADTIQGEYEYGRAMSALRRRVSR